jgi:lysophospholipase L1-like esterase
MAIQFTRRSFLGLAGISPLMASASSATAEVSADSLTILFQGDSITDGNRGRSNDPNHILGHGFAFAVASKLGSEFPERNLTFINKGVSGDTIEALHARWKTDAIELAPNVISILIGVNDAHHRISSGRVSEPSSFEKDLKRLVKITAQSLPNVKLVLAEPFILPVGIVKENLAQWTSEIKMIQESVAAVAKDYDCMHLCFQNVFTDALKRAPAEYWIWDGIHPTVSGHGLMAKEWIKQVGAAIPALALK